MHVASPVIVIHIIKEEEDEILKRRQVKHVSSLETPSL